LGEGQGRQDGWQEPREQRLAAAGWADHEQVVVAGRRDLERAARGRLTAHVSKVAHTDLERRDELGARGLWQLDLAGETLDHLFERARQTDTNAADQARLRGVAKRDDRLGETALPRPVELRQNPADRL